MFEDNNGVSCFIDNLGNTSWIDNNGVLLTCTGTGTGTERTFTIHLV